MSTLPAATSATTKPGGWLDNESTALLALTCPGRKFIVLTAGGAISPGKSTTKLAVLEFTTVTFTATALAVLGMPHCPARLKERLTPAGSDGPPNGPNGPRVSMIRHGGRVKNFSGNPAIAM